MSMGVFTDKDENGELVITDALFGLEMVGEVIYNVDVQIGTEVRYVTKIYDIEKCDVLGVPSFVLNLLSLFVTFAVVAFTIFFVVHIDAIIDKILDMKRTMKIFIRSFSLCFHFVVARNRGEFFVQCR